MVAKGNRLTSAEFARVFQRGRVQHGRAMRASVYDAQGSAKCAVVVSKKVAKSAVARNRARRQWYASIAESGYLTTFPTRHTIIFLTAEALTLSTTERTSALKQTLFS